MRRDDSVFQFRPELGNFIIPERMLRAGGSVEPLTLTLPTHATRAQYLTLPYEQKDRILHLIDHVYCDQEYEI